MEISDIRVKLIHQSKERLRAVCSVTFDDAFVVRDLKVVDGTSGLFVAMPSRKLSAPCPRCRHKNEIRARYCNECGSKLPSQHPPEGTNGRSRLHRDIAHPINTEFRELIQAKVLEAFQEQLPQQENFVEPEIEQEGGWIEEQRAAPTAAVPDEQNEHPQESEYDSLIAGLNAPKGGSRKEPRTQDQGRDRPDDRDPGGRRSRGRRKGRSEERRAVATGPQARPASEPPAVRDELSGLADEGDKSPFGVDLPAAARPPTEAPVPAEVQPEVCRSSDDVQEGTDTTGNDDEGFGAGLL